MRTLECVHCGHEFAPDDEAAVFDDGDIACVGDCADRVAWEKAGVTVDVISNVLEIYDDADG